MNIKFTEVFEMVCYFKRGVGERFKKKTGDLTNIPSGPHNK